MDEETLRLIKKFEGLDICCGTTHRMFCPEHMWEVPPIYRKRFLTKIEKEGLTKNLGMLRYQKRFA